VGPAATNGTYGTYVRLISPMCPIGLIRVLARDRRVREGGAVIAAGMVSAGKTSPIQFALASKRLYPYGE
jgi:hypothetical protein